MFKNWLLFLTMVLLAYGIWLSSEFKTIAAGVAIFLFGMMFMEQGFTAFTGGTLERLLQRSTDNLFKSHFFGLVSTSIMQSSSLVSVIAISFLSAGLIDLMAGIGIIFGANIGTTTGAWLMAAFGMKVKLSAYALPMLVFGLILTLQKQKSFKGTGNILAGIGFLFLGIHYMKEGFETVKDTIDLAAYAMEGYAGIFVFALVGVVATVVMQSSHATLMLVIAALASGQITYENALALAIGANIGTTVTAILGALNANVSGKRLALAHLIFNTVTALLAIVFIGYLRMAVDAIAMEVGVESDNWTLKLAIFHTVFNVIGVIAMLPFIGLLVRFLERVVILKEKRSGAADEVTTPLYLNDSALYLPDTALEVLIKETAHLFDIAFEIIAHGLNLHRMDILSGRELDDLVLSSRQVMDIDVSKKYYRGIKSLYGAIIKFASEAIAKGNMSENQLDRVHNIRIVCRNIAFIIKTIAELRENLARYIDDDNEDIRKQYDQLRIHIALVIRRIFRIRDSNDEMLIFLTLKELREDVDAQDVLNNGILDQLVRSGAITSDMTTSLMNDSENSHRINKALIEIAERMFIAEGTNFNALGDEVLHEESDFSKVTN